MVSENIYSLANELENLNVAEMDLDNLSDDEIERLHKLVSLKPEFKKFNQLAYWKPYPYQLNWIEASKTYRQRYLSAANRIGKTYSACMELAIHITGLYPEWWNGRKFDFKEPATFWAIGVSQDALASSLYKNLLGVTDCRNLTDLGSGTIPRDNINIFSLVKDGARCIQLRVKHVNGHENVLQFFASTQDESVFMGASVDYVLMDEQFPNETELFAQCFTRTATTRGMVSVTATPEKGQTQLWKEFHANESGRRYMQIATWDDAPHLTEEDKAELLAGYPTYQHKMRKEGIPLIGEAAVYPFSEEEINGSVTQAEILANPAEWLMMWSCDFGKSDADGADPSVLLLLAHNVRTDRTFTLYEWNSKQDARENRLSYMPEHMATIIKSSAFPNAPLLCPHDANNAIEGKANTTRITEFLRCGVNVHRRVFEIPLRYTMGAIEKPKHNRDLVFTIQLINKFFRDGTLKIDTKGMRKLWEEYQIYQWQKNGKPNDNNNHHLDALRLGAISIRDKGAFAFRCIGSGRTTEGNYKKVNQAYRDTRFI